MKGKNKPWDKPFHERLEQSKKDKRPRIMRAQGKRLYRVITKPMKTDTPWEQGVTGTHKGYISSISYSWSIQKQKVEIKWMAPKKATFLTLQGHDVTELLDDTQEEMDYYNYYTSIG